jgi:hypothetical protein
MDQLRLLTVRANLIKLAESILIDVITNRDENDVAEEAASQLYQLIYKLEVDRGED